MSDLNNNESGNDLEKLLTEESIIKFNPTCIRKKSNISKSYSKYRFDSLDFSPRVLLNDIPTVSPKLEVLLKNIEKLDKRDKERDGVLYKHFIFSDLKSSSAGAKLLASALIAKGYTLGYDAPKNKGAAPSKNDGDESDSESLSGGAKKKTYGKIAVLDDADLKKTKSKNFFLLASSGVFEQPISVGIKKEMLKKFNQRPDNIHGEHARFMVMDSGFKEGIDLFDIKYVHIFEPSILMSDQKQVIGRGTRTCGQKGLDFHPTRGWPLHVFVYDLEIPEKLRPSFIDTKSAIDLYLKAMNLDIRLFHFAHDLEQLTVVGSVDYDLNKNVHSFSIANEDNEEGLAEDSEFVYGGKEGNLLEGGAHRKFIIRKDLAPIVVPSKKKKGKKGEPAVDLPNGVLIRRPMDSNMGHEDMREYIQENFSQYSWEKVKMENKCGEVQKGGAGDVITYSPTQDFIRHYFTPESPIKGMLLWNSVGTGKCHAKDTPILMYDGSIKMVQNIQVGEVLMGDDSTPRTVLSLAQGQDELYDINPVKGEKYTVNSEHILCLKPTRLGVRFVKKQKNLPYTAPYISNKTGKVVAKSFATKEEANEFLDEIHNGANVLEIPVCDYLKLSKSAKKDLKGYRSGVHFPSKPVDFDPYIIGFWLGDGSKRDPVITTQDSKVLHYLFQELPKQNLSLNYQSGYDYRISSAINKGENKMLKALQKYNLINNKHIPMAYKVNDMNVRLQILAGLIDSDGNSDNNGYEITQKNKQLAEDILFLARSLGFAAYMKECEKSCMYKGEKKTGIYHRITISGDLSIVPVKIDRKRVGCRLQKKNVLVTGIDVKSIGKGDYYGFTLDGNNRYLLGDFTVTHNTCSAIATATTSFEREGYTILWVTRTTLKSDIWKNMFEQVCNEDIRDKLINTGLKIPDDNTKRMKLVSKAWSIRPMSYKQFSNLVSKSNSLYKSLVKKNGEEDPLRKTLLIIDEAHKLYGGADLSSIERPDMPALHKALMSSYQISGKDSVKLLLMTATPITKDPTELIQLINLCKPPEKQMPTTFDEFSEIYLNDEGKFTNKGKDLYLDQIAGYVSYLNREKDARQFSQPILHQVLVPMVKDMENLEKFDKKYVRQYLDSDVSTLKQEIQAKMASIDDDLKDLDKNRFNSLYDKCDDLEEKPRKACEKVVRENIRLLIQEVKEHTGKIKDELKDLKEELKNKNLFKREKMGEVKDNIEEYKEDYAKFKTSLYYTIRNECGKTIRSIDELKKAMAEHPDIVEYDHTMEQLNARVLDLTNGVKQSIENNKKRIAHLKKILKKDLSALEASVIKLTIKDERKSMAAAIKSQRKESSKAVKIISKSLRETKKLREKKFKSLRKTLKKRLSDEKKEEKALKRAENKSRKALRKEGLAEEEIKHELLKELTDKYSKKITDDLDKVDLAILHKEEEKIEKFRVKQQEKEDKKKAKETEKRNAKEEKERLRQTKKLDKDKEKEAKKKAKEAEKQLKKTQKNKK